MLATRNGLVKKSKLTDFDSNRSGGIVAINLRGEDELVGAVLCSSDDDLLLVSAQGQSIRFSATDEALRPMGRATSGVQGMRFNGDDELLSLNVVREGTYLLVATSGGYSKRTGMEDYPVQGRGGKGVLTIQYDKKRGTLVGALIVERRRRALRDHLGRWRHPHRRQAGPQGRTADQGRAFDEPRGRRHTARDRAQCRRTRRARRHRRERRQAKELRSPSEHSQPAGQ